MFPTQTLQTAIVEAAAADTGFLAHATLAMKVHLAIENFVPGPNLVLADIDLATFAGSTALLVGVGTQPVGIDPGTGKLVISLKEPAGGLRWEATAAPSPAQTVYGILLTNNAGTVLYGSELLPAPVTISQANHFVEVGNLRFTFPIPVAT